MRMRADLFHHVELPDDVRVLLAYELFILKWPVVFAVEKSLRIETDQFAAIGDVVKTVAFNERRGANALIGQSLTRPAASFSGVPAT